MVTESQIPPTWGKDKLADFCEKCRHNTIGTFVNAQDRYRRLKLVDEYYWTLKENLTDTPRWFSGLFVHHAHMCFLGGARLSLAGQFAEVYPLLRACIEYALHGFHFRDNEEAQEVWLRRSDSKKARDKAGRAMTARKMLREFKEADPKAHAIVTGLYEHCIDHGGHPNDGAVLANLKLDEGERTVGFTQRLLDDLGTPQHMTLKDTAAVGAGGLVIFQHVWETRYKLTGLDQKLERLLKEL